MAAGLLYRLEKLGTLGLVLITYSGYNTQYLVVSVFVYYSV